MIIQFAKRKDATISTTKDITIDYFLSEHIVKNRNLDCTLKEFLEIIDVPYIKEYSAEIAKDDIIILKECKRNLLYKSTSCEMFEYKLDIVSKERKIYWISSINKIKLAKTSILKWYGGKTFDQPIEIINRTQIVRTEDLNSDFNGAREQYSDFTKKNGKYFNLVFTKRDLEELLFGMHNDGVAMVDIMIDLEDIKVK